MLIRRRAFIAGALTFLALPLGAQAQAPGKAYRVGVLTTPSAQDAAPFVEILRQGLRQYGYVEGQNLVFEMRFAAGKSDRLPELGAELVRVGVDVIFGWATRDVAAARSVTSTIPIVGATMADPVGVGLATSLARPGGNVTGFTLADHLQVNAKRLEMLRETVPNSPIAVLVDPTAPNYNQFKEISDPARSLGIVVELFDAAGPVDFKKVFPEIKKRRFGGLLVQPSMVFWIHRADIAKAALANHLPSVFFAGDYARLGGLMSYDSDVFDLTRRAATYVHKILNGTKPGDLPIQEASKFELTINLKTAKALGLTIPPSLLLRADRVIQ